MSLCALLAGRAGWKMTKQARSNVHERVNAKTSETFRSPAFQRAAIENMTTAAASHLAGSRVYVC